jgi:capsular polysaccharide biosynthesis protein
LQIKNISNFRFIKKIILLISFYLKKFIKLIDKKEEIEKGIIIHNRQSSGYFHWVNDILLKIIIIKKLKKFDKYPLILPKNLKSNFHFESLKLLNMNFVKQKHNLTIKRAIYIPDLSPSGSPRPKILKLLSDKLKKFSKEKKLQKIYISRKKSRRKIVNEDQLIKILLKYNFKIYFMEDLKFIDQISICNSATVLIGLHGAGLTNSIWMKKNSTLLEIRPKNVLNLNCYFAIANILKLKYYYFFCTKKTFFKSVTNSNYFIDTIRFEKEFCNILKS